MGRSWLAALVVVGLTAGGCTDPKAKMRERQRRLDAERKSYQEAEEAKRKAAQPKVEVAQLEPFWGDPSYVRIATGRPCPEGLGALFTAPGAASDEATISRLRGATYVSVHSQGNGVNLRQYNPKKKALTVEVDGVVECYDSAGPLTVAWGEPAKPYRATGEDEDEEAVPQSVWRARPLRLQVPFPTPTAAKRFAQGEGLALEARLVYRLGKVDVDSKVKKVSSETGASGEVDWGAGRLVRVELLGVRLAVDHEKTAVLENRKSDARTAR